MSDRMSGCMPERMSDRISEYVLERMSDKMGQCLYIYISHIYFQTICQKLWQNSVSGRSHSKQSNLSINPYNGSSFLTINSDVKEFHPTPIS